MLAEIVESKHMILNRPTANEMFVDDPVQNFRRDAPIPGAVWIDNGYRALFADPKTVDL